MCNLNKGCGYGCQIHHLVYCFIIAYGKILKAETNVIPQLLLRQLAETIAKGQRIITFVIGNSAHLRAVRQSNV